MDNKKVKSDFTLVYLQTATRIPGMGETVTTLDATKGYTLLQDAHGLRVVKGDGIALIPWANVKMALIK